MKNISNKQIGLFIKTIREGQGISQLEFSQSMKTSQSAIARMEKGNQNFTTEMLNKVSKSLNHKILSIADQSVDFRIKGGRTLSGSVTTNYSKNGAMSLICASILNKGTTLIKGIPHIEEVNRMIEVLKSLDVSIKWVGGDNLEIKPPKELSISTLSNESAKRTRTAFMLTAPLAHLVSKGETFVMPQAGGCKLGKRTLAGHIYAMTELGLSITESESGFIIKKNPLQPAEVTMYESGDTATESAIMLAAKIPGKTTLYFASANYQVQDLCFFLEKCGVKFEGIGTTTLTIYGVEEINKTIEHNNSEDPTEAMMWVTAGIMTQSQITVTRCPIDFLRLEMYKLKTMGLKFKLSTPYLSNNNRTSLVDIEVFPSKLTAPEMKLYGRPYPGLNIDNLPFFVPIATQAKGQTLIHDWVWENRAIYFMEFTKMGADMVLADPHRVFINGPTQLKATQIATPPALRPSVALLIGMLAADGTSILRNIYSIARGYENIAERLNSLGAKIEIIS